jgi:glycine dehydrogenase
MSLNWKYQESFSDRHIGPDEKELHGMLKALGVGSLDELIDQTVPAAIRSKEPLKLAAANSEHDALAVLETLASKNQLLRSFIGMGYYDTQTPYVILRNILQNPGWYTQYTPYQAEIAQGRLEALLNFQTMVMDLTGLEVANASLLDEGTAAAEAMALALHTQGGENGGAFFVSEACHPQTIDVVRTRAQPLGVDVVVGDHRNVDLSAKKYFGALVQYPATDGVVHDYRAFGEKVHAAGGLFIVATDLLALTMLTPPGEFGADVAVGSAQRFGVPMGYGGPHAAFFATKNAYTRVMPGRIIGVSEDAQGRRALRMALQTREQHIRREKATSNICTAQALNALAGMIYLSWLGREGLVELGELLVSRTHYARETLAAIDGVELWHDQPVVREFALKLDKDVLEVLEFCAERGVNAGYPLADNGLLVAITEQRSKADIDRLAEVLTEALA